MPNMSDSRIWFTTAVFRVSILKKYLILFGNFVETLLSDGLPKGAGCLKRLLFLQPQFSSIKLCFLHVPAWFQRSAVEDFAPRIEQRMVMSCGHWLTISTVCPIGCDNVPASGEAAIRADNFTVVLSNRGLGAAMVGYVYNLGIKKRYKCIMDNRIQTNSRQNKESPLLLH